MRNLPFGPSLDGLKRAAAPQLPYRPCDPKSYRLSIGLIACGGITLQHLTAYKRAGYRVVALCDLIKSRALERKKAFYPRAEVYTDYRDVLKRSDIEVVDIATHPEVRAEIIKDALNAGKHVLSQKPFVVDLDVGERLADFADRRKLKLAVNQNGRWAPHFSYMRHVVQAGLLGEVFASHLAVHWDHAWTAGTVFDRIKHLILYDFGIHWFDITRCFLPGKTARRVHASMSFAPKQVSKPPLLAQALIEFDDAQASLVFDGAVKRGRLDTSYIASTRGSILSAGPDLARQNVILCTEKTYARPRLQGSWFPDGMHGTMAELLCAIEEEREPTHNARDNLKSLALCFAACQSAETSRPVAPGKVRRLL
ncbi:MAG: Gfo/Idh/MocA family oxidoreductase [Candidatus Hydrogenedentes bacterium]|nr:Gfo/Idh/MocA family oxidoreductase [Candidatus Hydrogenedentota bacterium]